MDLRRSINTKMWADDWFENLNPTEKLLWIYLLTNSQTNMLGIYEVSIKRISFETGLSQAQIEKTLESFESVRKAFYWFGWVFLPNWMKNQSLNTNMIISAEKIYNKLPNELKDKLNENGLESFESLSKAFLILPKKEIEIESEIEGEKDEKKIPNGWEAEPETYQFILSNYPKIMKMARPLTFSEHTRLKEKYGAKVLRDIYRDMESWAKLNTKTWAAGVADKWGGKQLQK